MNDINSFLRPTSFINSDHPLIKQKTDELTSGASSDTEKVVRLFDFVRDKCKYNMYATSGDISKYQASTILASGQGWCMQKAILLSALCRAAKIPCGLILATICNHKSPPDALDLMGTNIFFPHMYNYIMVNNNWIKVAPTFDRSLCAHIGVPVVVCDGIHDATLPAKDLQGQPYIEYLEEHGIYPDLPWAFIVDKSYGIYGALAGRWLGSKTL